MKLTIRKAAARDLDAILLLYEALEKGSGSRPAGREKAAKIFRRMQKYPDYAIYLAAAGKEIVGTFALLIMDNLAHGGAPSAIVEDVAVAEAWQGKGIGKKMMAFAMEICRKKGCYKLSLSSNLKRKQAHAFYASLSFRKHGYSFSVELPRPAKE